VKKWVVALFLGLALVVLISPGLIGRLAERSVDENIRSGTVESDDVVVSALNFDRGWFTTEGQHRIEFKESGATDRFRQLMDLPPDAPLPVLVVTTRIDHGIFPVASMNREDSSLAPGLGDAISTIRVDMPDGEAIDVPGVINSSIGLTGAMRSTYELPAGTFTDNGEGIRWSDGRVSVATTPANHRIHFDAALDDLEVLGGGTPVRLEGLAVEGEQAPSGFGFALGEVSARIDSIVAAGPPVGPIETSGSGRIDDGRLAFDFSLDMSSEALSAGRANTLVDLHATGIDPVAFGRLLRRYQALAEDVDSPGALAKALDPELRALAAGGFVLDLERLEVALPDGTLEAIVEVAVAENDADAESWSSLLLATEATADLRVPEPLMTTLMQLNPEAGAAAVGMGYLKADGDAYVSEVRYAKGILTINGAPMTIPLPAP
jgi:uncharacterized protein YdgA (DUF945 family)